MKVYIDMDGVIANWVKGFKNLTGVDADDIKKKFPNQKERHAYKEKIVTEKKLYENLPVMPGAKAMVKFIIDNFDEYQILSACGEYATSHVLSQKRKWLSKNFPELAKNPKFTIHAEQKSIYANENSILIDDMEKSIKPFKSGGGTGILHKSSSKTISELKKFIEKKELKEMKLLEIVNNILNEVLITFGKKAYPKFNNVVILAGGAASGKGFIKDKLLGIEGYVSDVDELKSLAMKAPVIGKKLKEMGIDIDDPNVLKNPDNVSKLHNAFKVLGIDSGKMKNLYQSISMANPDRKPNIIFDVTLQDITKLKNISKAAENLGYEKKNIHVVWIINSVSVAIEQNKDPKRGRVVPEDILIATHEGAALTMKKIADMGNSVKTYLDGDVYFVFNNKKVNDVEFVAGNKKMDGGYIKKATFLKIKEQGKGVDASKITQDFLDKIVGYVPKTKIWAKKMKDKK